MRGNKRISIRENRKRRILIPRKCRDCFWIDRIYEKTNEGFCEIEFSFIDLGPHNTCIRFKFRIGEPILIDIKEYTRLKGKK